MITNVGSPIRLVLSAALFLTIVLQLPAPLYGQRLMFGATVGGQMISTFAPPGPPSNVDENRFLIGPLIEAHLPGPLSIEAQALYKSKLDYFESYSGLISTGQTQTANINATAHAWEIPVILKWHVRPARNSLFVGGGFVARNIAGATTQVIGTNSGDGLATTTFDYNDNRYLLPNPWTFGGVAAFGFDIRAGLFHLQPELRYTRWSDSPFSPGYARPNSVDALFSVAVGKNKG